MSVRVVVVGGGFAGRAVALALDAEAGPGGPLDLTWVCPEARQALTPLLFEVASGVLPAEAASHPNLGQLRHGTWVQACAQAVDLPARQLRLDDGRSLPFDHLVLAVGLPPRRPPWAGPEALAFKGLQEALDLQARLAQGPASVAIVGGGLVGVELAGELAVALPQAAAASGRGRPLVSLVEAGPSLAPELPASLAEEARRQLVAKGVVVRTGLKAIAHEGDRLRLEDGGELPAECLVLALGNAPHPLLASLGLPLAPDGRLPATAALQAHGAEGLWVLGDAAALPMPGGGLVPGQAQHAVRQAPVLVHNLLAQLRRQALRDFVPQPLGLLASLGPGEGLGELLGWRLWGGGAFWLRRAYYLGAMAGPELAWRQVEAYAQAWWAQPLAHLGSWGGLLPPEGFLGGAGGPRSPGA